jgi:hypothetical protein
MPYNGTLNLVSQLVAQPILFMSVLSVDPREEALPIWSRFRYSTSCSKMFDLEDLMSVEVRAKRCGVVAVEKGFINKEQLFEALKIQIEEDLQGKKHNLIGIILIGLGYLAHGQADEVLLEMKR